ncbi:VCBS repeat-containing protein [Halomonas nitroreducens]|uniref:VCBS repeat-containing protein n=1 Tax=Halomonas nitroreducens TaxID=447425 RepID=A0A431V5V0_9GAMM|nr:VCBS repeat-containing protein [Halomonas nitroreducens]RTR05880.1 VCBS repeat-containing protein [Halomonas nitroreducens]
MKAYLLSLCALIVVLAPAAQAERIVTARYAEPVERYGHFALGRPHEYARLVATTDAGRDLGLALPRDEVFEDLAPRLVQLTDQASPALLVIVSSRDDGARLALVGLDGKRLEIVAQSAPIGRPNRWLNPVGVADLSGDGEAEIAAVTTPHLGGVLRVYRRRGERLVELASLGGFSNHVYGASELRLSRPARINGRMQLLVPDGRRENVRVVALSDAGLVETDRRPLSEPITGPEALDDCERRLNQAASVTPQSG